MAALSLGRNVRNSTVSSGFAMTSACGMFVGILESKADNVTANSGVQTQLNPRGIWTWRDRSSLVRQTLRRRSTATNERLNEPEPFPFRRQHGSNLSFDLIHVQSSLMAFTVRSLPCQ